MPGSLPIARPRVRMADKLHQPCGSCSTFDCRAAMTSMRRFFQRFEDDVPALAVHARAAGERGRKGQVERRDFPPVLRAAQLQLQPERLQQVVRRVVFAMLLLYTFEEGETIHDSQSGRQDLVDRKRLGKESINP